MLHVFPAVFAEDAVTAKTARNAATEAERRMVVTVKR
jgi:hypothetical protein